ncbi:MAG: IS4 family transposase [Planctomycetota bacterium]|jgi:hypothetical protein
MWASGRHFDDGLIERIQTTVDTEPQLSRGELSRRVCQWLDWRSAAGRLQQMSCRKALLKLHRHGVLRLPAARGGFGFQTPRVARQPSRARPPVMGAAFRGCLAELGPIEIVPVASRHCRTSPVWTQLMEAHHYLGAGPLCGAQLRYLVRSEVHGWLGALAFSSATWRLKPREQWIGWSDRARRANLGRVIQNSRFLVLPTVAVPNLASHVLAQVLRQVGPDWEQRYGQRPLLVETFVDPQRFRGSCYRAANWIHIGQSAGGKEPHPNGTVSDGPKDIYVYALQGDGRKSLCEEPQRRLGAAARLGHAADWAEQEFGGLDVGDPRLRVRLLTLARDFFANPLASVPEACDGAISKAKAAYRFFANPQVDMDTILLPHTEATVARIGTHDVVLAVQDTTDLNYTHHPATEGLGPLQSIDDLTVGLKLHDTLAFTPQGTPLGLLDVQCWARDGSTEGQARARKKLPIEQKESFKWLQSFRRVAEIQQLVPDTMLVSVGDREADIFELFAEARADPTGPKLLVRAEKSRQRKVEQAYLWDHMARQDLAGYQELLIPRKGSRKARTARLAVRFAPVTLRPPNGHKGPAVTVWAVYSHEVDYDPAQIKNPLSWMLLTTVETATFDQACERLRWYAGRWGIEVYHRTLKSGCRIKDRKLARADRLETCLAIDMVIAWRLFWLTHQGRETPDMPCDIILAEEEWQALHAYIHQEPPPEQPPALQEAVRMIGKLGGFLGRQADGQPGTTVLWRGLRRLPDIAAGWRAFSQFGNGLRAGP